jgi:orotate phosphoribosyltransferase
MNPQETAEQVAKLLLKIKAVSLSPKSPFKWASGWLSPIYCDNRLTLGDPYARTFIADALAHHIQQYVPEAQAIAGVATAGIPQATRSRPANRRTDISSFRYCADRGFNFDRGQFIEGG